MRKQTECILRTFVAIKMDRSIRLSYEGHTVMEQLQTKDLNVNKRGIIIHATLASR